MSRTVFLDVNETLSDLGPLAEVLARVGAPEVRPAAWLSATLRDGFALGLTTGPRPFPEVARGAAAELLAAAPDLVVPLDDAVEQVVTAFGELPVHADVVDGLRRLHAEGHRVVTLSNGSADTARDLLGRAGVDDAVDAFLGADDVGAWKPDLRAYRGALALTGTAAEEAALVAVHPWDLHGARRAGLLTVHLDRSGAPWPPALARPDLTASALTELRLPPV